jgi:hypothetical protein
LFNDEQPDNEDGLKSPGEMPVPAEDVFTLDHHLRCTALELAVKSLMAGAPSPFIVTRADEFERYLRNGAEIVRD